MFFRVKRQPTRIITSLQHLALSFSLLLYTKEGSGSVVEQDGCNTPDDEQPIVMAWQVEETGSRVEAELGRILRLANDHATTSLSAPGSRAVAVYDPINNGVWVKMKGRSGRNVSVRPSPQLCEYLLPGSACTHKITHASATLHGMTLTCCVSRCCVWGRLKLKR